MMVSEDEATCKLTTGIIKAAIQDAKKGDRDAAQFLVAHDGAELWLRVSGVGVTNEIRNKLKLMAIGGERDR
jgi:tryptophan 2,3-dioxygenase